MVNDLVTAIKNEITNDPQEIGYAGKTDAEIVTLLNTPQKVVTVTESFLPPPISRILSGMGGGMPNQVTLNEVEVVKAVLQAESEGKTVDVGLDAGSIKIL